jgi:lysophospholipase L1-like esterase
MSAHGLVALGDSITRGRGGTPALGIHPQSWAQWLAEALELPFTNLAADGAVAADVVAGQLPRLRGPYDVATLYVGANDARRLDWDAARYAADVDTILAALAAAADRVLVLTIPHDLGRPRAAPKPAEAGRILRAAAGRTGAVVADLDGFGGRRLVLPDAVHPTSLGLLTIADVAARALDAPVLPSRLADPPVRGPVHAARYEAWWARLWLRDRARRARERARPSS